MDLQYIYFLRRRGSKVTCLMAVRVPYAKRREQLIHKMFDCSRFEMTRRQRIAPNGVMSSFESQCKIGITNDLKRRHGTIQADKLSGKTEWFTLSWMERWCVRYWLAKWWLKFYGLIFAAFVTLLYLLALLL